MFLKEEDAKKFTKKKLDFQNDKPFYHFLTTNFKEKDITEDFKLVDIPTLSGNIRIQGSEKLKNYSVEVEKTLNEHKNSYVKIKDGITKATVEIQQATTTIEGIEREFKALEKSSADFIVRMQNNGGELTYGWADLSNTHRSMSETFAGLKTQLEKLKFSLKATVFPEMKYSKKECESALELVRYRNQAAQAYFCFYESVKRKKELLVATGDRNKWDLPTEANGYSKEQLLGNVAALKQHLLKQESRVAKQMKSVYGYLNTTLVRELSHNMAYKALREIKSLASFSAERIERNK